MDATACKEALASAETAARVAGEIIMAAVEGKENTRLQVKSGVDLVTETDKAAERAIIRILKGKHPTHQFMGEESSFEACKAPGASEDRIGGGGGGEISTSPTWIIDPLDGTTNFVHGYPLFCVSIALVVGRIPILGVVFHPCGGDLYTACQGAGAFLNGVKIQVRVAGGLNDALVMNNIGAARDEAFISTTVNRLGELLRRNVQAVRMSGSAALNMCHVACGKLDCYFEDGYGGPWDVAAGVVIVTEFVDNNQAIQEVEDAEDTSVLVIVMLVHFRTAGGIVRGLRNEYFALKVGPGQVVCGHDQIVGEICDALAAADGVSGNI